MAWGRPGPVLGSLTLCLQLIDRAAGPRDEDDAKGDSWKELNLLKAVPSQPQPPPAARSLPDTRPAPCPSAPGEWALPWGCPGAGSGGCEGELL